MTFFLISCSDRRIDLIEETFQISLPEKYKVLKNTTESSGFSGSNYEINVQLQFDSKNFNDLIRELKKIEGLKDGNRYYKNLENREISSLIVNPKKKQLMFQFIHL